MDIRVVDIAKDFYGTGALRGVSIDIRDGELIALLGPSGSGKTTLLRIIAGLETATAGHVYFGDEDATNLPVQNRRIGFVFQNYALFKHMTVFDNIAYGLTVRPAATRPSREAIRARVGELLDLIQLPGIDKRYPNQLSGGQRQRVALARALAVEPRLLLLDEPFGALDAKVRKDLRRWLRDLHDRTGHTTVFVTHDQEEALELADRVAILNQGRLEQIGSADDVHDRPASAFVMSFVGDTSCLPVIMRAGRPEFGGKPILAEIVGTASDARQLYLRPDDVELADSGLPGRVVSERRTATGRRVQVQLEAEPGAQGPVIEIEIPARRHVAIGETVKMRILRGRLFS